MNLKNLVLVLIPLLLSCAGQTEALKKENAELLAEQKVLSERVAALEAQVQGKSAAPKAPVPKTRAPTPRVPEKALERQPGTESDYVIAAIEIACAGKRMTSKSEFTSNVAQIQRKAGFTSE